MFLTFIYIYIYAQRVTNPTENKSIALKTLKLKLSQQIITYATRSITYEQQCSKEHEYVI